MLHLTCVSEVHCSPFFSLGEKKQGMKWDSGLDGDGLDWMILLIFSSLDDSI